MTKVYAVLTTTDTPSPSGQTYGSTSMTCKDGAGGVQTATSGAITMPDGSSAVGAVFEVTAAGAGEVTAQALDTNGQPMGAAVSGSFSIPIPVPTYPQPASVVVTLG